MAMQLGLLLLLFGCASSVFGEMKRCERITLPLCHNLGYNLTVIPSGHANPMLAVERVQPFLPLLHSKCSRHLRFLVCSLVAPLCSELVPSGVPACRSLCEEVRSDCIQSLTALQLSWPAALECTRFPVQHSSRLCMRMPENHTDETELSTPKSQFRSSALDPSPAVTLFPVPPLRASIPAETCDSNGILSDHLLVAWAGACLIASMATLLTAAAQPARFRYPQRPIIFLALCYALLALAQLIRAAAPADTPNDITCVLTFIITHYLSLTSAVWWAALAACWYLAAARDWSSEALAGLAPYLHAAAWAGPAVPALTALTLQPLPPATLALLAAPQAALLGAALVMATAAATALRRVRAAVRAAGRPTATLERLAVRLAALAVFYAIPAAAALGCLMVEASVSPTPQGLASLRSGLTMLGGVSCGVWVCSRKTLRAWCGLVKSHQKERVSSRSPPQPPSLAPLVTPLVGPPSPRSTV